MLGDVTLLRHHSNGARSSPTDPLHSPTASSTDFDFDRWLAELTAMPTNLDLPPQTNVNSAYTTQPSGLDVFLFGMQ